ncbi:Isochorismatase hydrolase [Aulographum hederae CBS 113979]|uniref:Isochorismatase hydrolase n=1 Tax=Aulographum hederae CBS 113979 TaxID=1176131 RepID=A0A6G1HHQ3_9PEZI|nr:Isochorismatase hydrolase [Aulographum hederae CBS 113979]
MRFTTAIVAACGLSVATAGSIVPFERLEKNNSVLLIVDHQVGLFHLAKDWDATLLRNNIVAHASLGKLFDLPVVMTTSAETGPNGPLPKEILEMYPNSPLIKRNGEVDAWDNPSFRAAVRATGKKQVILAGIVTDVCTTFLALSLRAEGYSVWANVEASGTTTQLLRDTANMRMQGAGVNLGSLFGIATDLMRDWRNVPGAAEVMPYLGDFFPAYGFIAKLHAAAVNNGSLIPGEAGL